MITPQCHVMIPLKINMIFLDLSRLNRVKFTLENKAKMVFFRRFLGYVIYQWSNSNAPHTHFTVIFLNSNLSKPLRQLVICDTLNPKLQTAVKMEFIKTITSISHL